MKQANYKLFPFLKRKPKPAFLITGMKLHSGVKDITNPMAKWGTSDIEIRTLTITLTSFGEPNLYEISQAAIQGKKVQVTIIE